MYNNLRIYATFFTIKKDEKNFICKIYKYSIGRQLRLLKIDSLI